MFVANMDPIRGSPPLSPLFSPDSRCLGSFQGNRTQSLFDIHEAQPGNGPFNHYRLRHALIQENELLPDGGLNPKGFFAKVGPVAASERAFENMLSQTFTIQTPSGKRPFTLRQFVAAYQTLFPYIDIQWIGSSQPLRSLWHSLFLKDLKCSDKLKALLTESIDYIIDDYPDIDLRFAAPPEMKANTILAALESMTQAKLPHLEKMCFQPEDKVMILPIKKGSGNNYDIDFVQTAKAEPPFLTTLDAPYLSISDYLTRRDTHPRFLGGVTAGEYFIHRCAKIFYVPDRKNINAGAFKKLVKAWTYSLMTPQDGIVKTILYEYNKRKSGVAQFENIFQHLKSHLLRDAKTELAYCLNLIVLIQEFYPEKYKQRYWEKCSLLTSEKPQKELLEQIKHFIETRGPHLGFLIAALEASSLMIDTVKAISKRTESSQSILRTYPAAQNGSHCLVLPFNKTASVSFSVHPEQTFCKLLDLFKHWSKIPAEDQKTARLIVPIMLDFIRKILPFSWVKWSPDDCKGHLKLICEPQAIHQIFTGNAITEEPILHLLHLFWTSVFYYLHPGRLKNEREIIISLAPALSLLKNQNDQRHLLDKLAALSFTGPLSKIVTVLQEGTATQFPDIFMEIIKILGSGEQKDQELGFAIWKESLSSPHLEERTLSRSFFLLIAPHFTYRQTVWTSRILTACEERNVNPLLLAEQFLRCGFSKLAKKLLPCIKKEDGKKYPRSLETIAEIESKLPTAIRFQLITSLVETSQWLLAKEHIRKISMKSLSEKECLTLRLAANTILRFLSKQPCGDLFIETIGIFASKALINPKTVKECETRWKLLDNFRHHNGKINKIKPLLHEVRDLLAQTEPLNKKALLCAATFLNYLIDIVPVKTQSEVIAAIHTWNQAQKSKRIDRLIDRWFRHSVNLRRGENIHAADYFVQRREWGFAAEMLTNIASKDIGGAACLARQVIENLDFQDEGDLRAELLLLFQPELSDDQIQHHSESLISFGAKRASRLKLQPLLTSWLRRLQVIESRLALHFLIASLRNGATFENRSLLFSLISDRSLDLEEAFAAFEMISALDHDDNEKKAQQTAISQLALRLKECDSQPPLVIKLVDTWLNIGLPPQHCELWSQLFLHELRLRIRRGEKRQLIDRLKCLYARKNVSSLVDNSLLCFFRHQKEECENGSLVHFEIFAELWQRFVSVKKVPQEEVVFFRDFALDGHDYEKAWELTKVVDALVFFKSDDCDLASLKKEWKRSLKWQLLIEKSVGADVERPSQLCSELFYKVFCRDIVDVRSSISQKNLISKIVRWAQIPEELVFPLDETDTPLEKTRHRLRATQLTLMDRIVQGLSKLAMNTSPITLSDDELERIQLAAAVLWILSYRRSSGHPSFEVCSYFCDVWVNKNRKLIEAKLSQLPSFPSYQLALQASRKNYRAHFLLELAYYVLGRIEKLNGSPYSTALALFLLAVALQWTRYELSSSESS